MGHSEETKFKIGLANAFTYKQVKEFIEIESNSGCKLLSKEYKNSNIELKIQCKCGNILKVSFNKFKNRNKRQCNKCSKMERYDVDKAKIIFLSNDLIPLFDSFKNVKEKLLAQTKENYLFLISLDSLINKKVKPSPFQKSNPYTIYNINIWIEYNAKGYILLSNKYINSTSKLDFECPYGHKFQMSWADFKQGKRCSICSASQGEKRISSWLYSHNIKYQKQYKFDNLRGKLNQPLRFDFGILDKGNNLLFLIEYDGIQHFKPARYSKDKNKMLQKLKEVQFRDNQKNNYCLENNISLLRIPYTEYNNIENILINVFNI